jgi:UDP-N-acetylmuramoylalanine--D-glutamate ligase
MCDLLQIEYTYLQKTLHTFWWLEHRLELVGTHHNIIRYNDAIATTPQATCAALDSFWDKIDTLFYGGIEGEYDHQLVAQKIRDYNIRHLVLFPDTWVLLFDLLDTNTKARVDILHTRSMHDAVQRAAKKTTPWAIALLSCGSPSFSVWSWFVEKGRLFKQEVDQLT